MSTRTGQLQADPAAAVDAMFSSMDMAIGATEKTAAPAITLQINTSGSWKNMLTFAPEQRMKVLLALRVFAGVIGDSASWCLLHESGRREWLKSLPRGPWQAVTEEQPFALQDVMVSAYAPDDKVPHTFIAWRAKTPDGRTVWNISGTDDEELQMEVYAFAPIIEPAPLPISEPIEDGGIVSGANRTTSGWIGQP